MASARITLQQHSPARNRRRRRALIVGGALIFALAGLFAYEWFTRVRQSAVRARVAAALRSVSQAAEAYERENGRPATLDDLIVANLIDVPALAEFSRCEPSTTTGEPAAPAAWLVQTIPCRAVRKGEPWGGPGEFLDRDLPPCRFLLMHDWRVEQFDEIDFQREFAGRVRLSPFP